MVLPSELEKVRAAKHLVITEEPYGGAGARAYCTAKNTATCDGGYKPLDCQFYPIFPQIKNGKLRLKAHIGSPTKCPLGMTIIRQHAAMVLAKVLNMTGLDLAFLKTLPLTGYKDVTDELKRESNVGP